MSIILTFLCIYFICWLLFKLLPRMGLYILNRKMKKTFNQAQQSRWQQPEERQGRKAGWSAPPVRKKKIDPGIGEYVAYQDIETAETTTTTTESSSETSSTYTSEQQVEDVKWEDV